MTVWCLVTCLLVTQLVKNPTCNEGDLVSTPGLGRSPGEGKGYLLQYSGLENSMDCSLLGSSVHGDFPSKNTGVGCHALLQGVFPTQGSHPGFSHCRWILYRLSHQGRMNLPLFFSTCQTLILSTSVPVCLKSLSLTFLNITVLLKCLNIIHTYLSTYTILFLPQKLRSFRQRQISYSLLCP